MSKLATPPVPLTVIKYEHHGKVVSVQTKDKGKHRDHCLCFSCIHFKPGTPDNCPIAQATYDNCVKFGTTTPVWECPNFYQKPLT